MTTNKNIFVAGASGMAGHAIIEELSKNYPDSHITGSFFSNLPDFRHLSNVSLIEADLRSLESCRNACKNCDFAIIAAAVTGGALFSAEHPWEQVSSNLIMNTQMLKAFQLENISRVLLIGSSTCYQECNGKIKEDDLNYNLNPFESHHGIGWVTRYIEKLAEFCHIKFGMEFVLVRAANIYGPYASFNPSRSNFIPALIRKSFEKMDPFEIWGSPDIERDVIYSKDFALACVKLLKKESLKFDVFNVGSGKANSIGEIVHKILDLSDHKPSQISYSNQKPTNIKSRILDCSKLSKTIDLEPIQLDNGLEKTANWWKEHHSRWNK